MAVNYQMQVKMLDDATLITIRENFEKVENRTELQESLYVAVSNELDDRHIADVTQRFRNHPTELLISFVERNENTPGVKIQTEVEVAFDIIAGRHPDVVTEVSALPVDPDNPLGNWNSVFFSKVREAIKKGL